MWQLYLIGEEGTVLVALLCSEEQCDAEIAVRDPDGEHLWSYHKTGELI